MKRSVVFLGLLTVAGVSAPARTADVEVVSTFEGNKGPGWKASANLMGAVGPSHVVDRQWCTAWAAFGLEQETP